VDHKRGRDVHHHGAGHAAARLCRRHHDARSRPLPWATATCRRTTTTRSSPRTA
jgi:hypothetical protein